MSGVPFITPRVLQGLRRAREVAAQEVVRLRYDCQNEEAAQEVEAAVRWLDAFLAAQDKRQVLP